MQPGVETFWIQRHFKGANVVLLLSQAFWFLRNKATMHSIDTYAERRLEVRKTHLCAAGTYRELQLS